MSALEPFILQDIAQNGPMTLARYMGCCLLHPQHGYYTTQTPFGQKGDFITAPEISQMFGELLGLCLARHWLDAGRPAPFTLAELGPGRGTLMADMLRATRGITGFHQAARIRPVEASPPLRLMQRQALAGYQVTWPDDISALDDMPLYLIANEFFDALPIRQFTRTAQGWHETVVTTQNNDLAFAKAPLADIHILDHRLADTKDGDIVEICPMAAPIMQEIAKRIHHNGGLAVIVDYGDWRSLGDTFQAMRRHQFTHPLHAPGTADLTAHVDFEALARHATPCAVKFTSQGALLKNLGIFERSAILAQSFDKSAQKQHLDATRRLTAADEMGNLFKALAIFSPNGPPPAGFSP